MTAHYESVRHIGVEHDLQKGHAHPDLRKGYYSRLNPLEIRQTHNRLFTQTQVKSFDGFLNKFVKRTRSHHTYIDLSAAKKEIKTISKNLQLSYAERHSLKAALAKKTDSLILFGARKSLFSPKLFITDEQAAFIFRKARDQDEKAKAAYRKIPKKLNLLTAFSEKDMNMFRSQKATDNNWLTCKKQRLSGEQRQTLKLLSVLKPQQVQQSRTHFQLKSSFISNASRMRERERISQQAKAFGYPAHVEKADIRLAHIIAQSKGAARYSYHPKHDTSPKAKSNQRYLMQLSRSCDFVRYQPNSGSFSIDTAKAVTAVNQRREIVASLTEGKPAFPDSKLQNHFKFDGKQHGNGNWAINPHTIKSQQFLPATIFRLHQYATFYPEYIRQDKKGNFILNKEGADLLGLQASKEAELHYQPGTMEWSQEVAQQYQGISDNLNMDVLDITKVKRAGRQPMTNNPSPNTAKKYASIAKRLRNSPLEEQPAYLCARANTVSRATWWRDRAAIIRTFLAAESQAFQKGDKALSNRLLQLRTGIEKMQYAALRSTQRTSPLPAYRKAFQQESYLALKASLKARGDMELHDCLVISKATGVRPVEIEKGIMLKQLDDGRIQLSINTAKKSSGHTFSEARFAARKGKDRTLVVQSDELDELYSRVGHRFKPKSTMAALQMRLNRARKQVSGAENITFYSFRHSIKTKLSAEKKDQNYIARFMGHRSTESQHAYGVK